MIYESTVLKPLGAVHKRRPQLGGGGGFVQCEYFVDKGEGGSSDVDVHIFWRKNFEFFEIYGVFVRWYGQGRRGVEPVRTFFGQGGRGQFFVILRGRRSLWTGRYTLLVPVAAPKLFNQSMLVHSRYGTSTS